MKGENCPEGFRKFTEELNKLKPRFNVETVACEYFTKHNTGLTNKKMHEILNLAPCIHHVCQEHNMKFIIDVGAGLVRQYIIQFILYMSV